MFKIVRKKIKNKDVVIRSFGHRCCYENKLFRFQILIDKKNVYRIEYATSLGNNHCCMFSFLEIQPKKAIFHSLPS